MKTTAKILFTSGLTLFMINCSSDRRERMDASKEYSEEMAPAQDLNSTDEEAKEKSTQANTINGFISSSAAVETGKDTTRKFIRTAEMKFRVKNVAQTTYRIEDLTSGFDGFVTYTYLKSDIDRKTITALSADSSLETIYFTVYNNITLRVPNTKLDTTLKTIATLIDYLDYRVINARDVALEILANKMKQDRMSISETQHTTVVESGGKNVLKSQITNDNPLYKQEVSDEAKLANLSLDDQIKFSTIKLSIYQRQEIKRWVIPNDKNIDAYEPGFGAQLLESLKYGWDILERFIVFIAKLWGFILFALLVYIFYKKFGHKLKIK